MARIEPAVGEVWFAELGMIEKSRPVLVLAPDEPRNARALVIVAPLTSQIRGQQGEVYLGRPRWLPKESAVNVQGLASFDDRKLVRRMGALTREQMADGKQRFVICWDSEPSAGRLGDDTRNGVFKKETPKCLTSFSFSSAETMLASCKEPT